MTKILEVLTNLEAATDALSAGAGLLAMPTLIRDVANHDWGWFSREDERMHLQTVDPSSKKGRKKVKFWLESRGQPVFEYAEGPIDEDQIVLLRDAVAKNRDEIEDQWVAFMIQNGWLKVWLAGTEAFVQAYPNSHNKYKRKVDLKKHFPGAYPAWDKDHPTIDIDPNGFLRIGNQKNKDHRSSVPLYEVLFSGRPEFKAE